MFGLDFYPTKRNTIEEMLLNVRINGKVCFEPEAGSGNIVDYLKEVGAKDIIACEIDQNLRSILEKKCRIIESDFLKVTADRISHVELIVMNPPFSQMEKHILHAWEIAPAGCEIISLCNSSLLENPYSQSREQIKDIVKFNGSSENFGDCFSDSERKTGVSVSCIHLYKQGTGNNEFDGYFNLTEEDEEKCDVPGIMSYNYVRDVVGRYKDAVNLFNDVVEMNHRMNKLISPIDGNLKIKFGAFNIDDSGRTTYTDRDTFKKELQKSAWLTLFNEFKMEKFITTKVKEKLNIFVEKQTHVPFTMKNVSLMVEMIIGTSEDMMNQVLVEAFEKICSFSSENSTAGEKWKTNSDYVINKRFIKPYVCEFDKRWPKDRVDISYNGGNSFDDIVKALFRLTGEDYESYIPLSTFFGYPYKLQKKDGSLMGGYKNCFRELDGWNGATATKKALLKEGIEVEIIKTCQDWGQWVDWGFFRVRGYKKGTMHFEFKDDRVLEMFNRRVAEIKGWRLPKSTKKAYRAKPEDVEIYFG
ncbi:MAG TPA: DUF4942 domain-containing protein [Candidatus Humimicrobiaceae bacterium]